MNGWKSTGSLMWIHGLRLYIAFVLCSLLIVSSMVSWIREKCALVCVATSVVSLSEGAHVIYQFNNHPRCLGRVSNWIGYARLLLL